MRAIQTIRTMTGQLRNSLAGRLTARTKSPRATSLVLSGGGARTLAQIGVIRAMEESGIPIEMVGGTGGGAIIAAMVAPWVRRRPRLQGFRRRSFAGTGRPRTPAYPGRDFCFNVAACCILWRLQIGPIRRPIRRIAGQCP